MASTCRFDYKPSYIIVNYSLHFAGTCLHKERLVYPVTPAAIVSVTNPSSPRKVTCMKQYKASAFFISHALFLLASPHPALADQGRQWDPVFNVRLCTLPADLTEIT